MARQPMTSSVLSVRGLQKRFGGVVAVDDVSLDLAEGEVHALIGPNGAGKTTLIHLLSGALKPSAGTVVLDGRDITGLASTGASGSDWRAPTRSPACSRALPCWRTWRSRCRRAGRPRLTPDRAGSALFDELDGVGLGNRADQLAGALAHGERRQLEVGLALATAPGSCCSTSRWPGWDPRKSARMIALLEALSAGGPCCWSSTTWTRCSASPTGSRCWSTGASSPAARPTQIRADPEVRRAYLGEEDRMTLLLEVDDLQAAYGASQVLFGVDLAIGAGEAVTLLGRNGMGKTTTVRSIMGLTPTSGTIRFGGRRIERDGAGPHRAGWASRWCPRAGRSFPISRVRENLIAFAANRGAVRRRGRRARLELFPAPGRARRQHGQPALRRRAADARHRPRAGDQPASPDPRRGDRRPGAAVREEIWRCLARLRAAGQTILVIDKYVERLVKLADRHTIIERGRVAWHGSLGRARRRPRPVAALSRHLSERYGVTPSTA